MNIELTLILSKRTIQSQYVIVSCDSRIPGSPRDCKLFVKLNIVALSG